MTGVDGRPAMTGQRSAAIWATVAALLWGIGYPLSKLAYEVFAIPHEDAASKLVLAGARFTLAGGILLAVAAHGGKPGKGNPRRRELALLALFQTALQYGLLYIGLANTSSAKSSILGQFGPFLLVLLAHVADRSDAFTPGKLAGCLSGLGGIILINLGGLDQSFSLRGEGMIILSSLSAAAGYIVSKRLAQSGNVVRITGLQQFMGGLALLFAGGAMGGGLHVFGPAQAAMLLVLALSIASAYAIWTALLGRHGLARIASFKFAVPVFGVLFSGLFLGRRCGTGECSAPCCWRRLEFSP